MLSSCTPISIFAIILLALVIAIFGGFYLYDKIKNK